MAAGTISLTNNSQTVTGNGTAFNTDLKANDFISVDVGGTTYTLGIQSVESDGSLTLLKVYKGPTQDSLAWTAIPAKTLALIHAELATLTTDAVRGFNLDKVNWQKVFSEDDDITVILTDLSQFSGPSWKKIVNILNSIDPDTLVGISEQVQQDAQQVASDKQAVETSETNAGNSATLSQKWAANPVNTVVQNGLYSSLHYASKAADSASSANTDAGTASTKASEATQSAASAKTDADRAQTANPDNQLKKASNLSDVANVATARTNLSVYSKAETDAFQPIVMTWAQAVSAGWVGAISTLVVSDPYDLMVTVSPNNIRVTGILGVTGGAGIPTAVGIYGISKYPTGKSGVHKPRQPCTYITQGTGNWGATASSKVDVLYSGSGTAGLTSYILVANAAGIFIGDVWYFV